MTYETVEYKGYNIIINQEEIHEFNPRDDDNLGKMYCFHSRYEIGDKHDLTKEEVIAMVESGDYIVLPLFLYEHSGITMNTTGFSCQWDSGRVGVIMVSKKIIKEEYGWEELTEEREQKIKDYLKGEVETYDHYLTGNVYNYTIEKDDDEIEDYYGCGGFYGYDFEKNGLLEQARETIDFHVQETFEREGEQMELNFNIRR